MSISRLQTVVTLLAVFASRRRWFLVPLVVVLLGAALLLVATSAFPMVAPFVYVIF